MGDGGFENRRDHAIIALFKDTGIRLAELAGIALTDVECYRLDKDGFQKVVTDRPEVVHEMSAMLAKRKAAVVAGEYLPCADMTMNELFDRFMQAKEGHPCRDDAAALREFAAALLAAGGRHQEGWQREGCRPTCNLCSMVEAASQRTYGPSCC